MTQTLEQLSAAATQGLIEAEDELLWSDAKYANDRLYGASRKGKAPMANFDDGEYTASPNPAADTAFIAALWNAYRTGQLVAVQADDAVEWATRIANTLVPKTKRRMAGENFEEQLSPDKWRVAFRAAIAAMKDTQP